MAHGCWEVDQMGAYDAGILPAIAKFTESQLVLGARGVHQIFVSGTCWF
jgi:hypothetical protein